MSFIDECIAFTGPVWNRYHHHPWIDALFAGTLDEDRFNYWLAQDLPYLGERISIIAFQKVPPHNPWAQLDTEYLIRAGKSRVELDMLEKYGDFAKTRWAARPRREAFVNFFARTVYEGTFGDICAAFYPCYTFPTTFGERYQREEPANLSDRQRRWVEQWVDPFFIQLQEATKDGLNEYGEHATAHQKEQMKWIFLRATNHQIGVFDAAWNLSDPWPGEGEESGVMAGPPV
jgi:thiaminase (transcriptional activator TenA)